MRLIRYITLFVAVCASLTAVARPRFAVNIVVSGMRHSDLARYEKNFSKEGFVRLRKEGTEFAECYVNYAPTTSEAGLATLATGALPAMHGIFSAVGFDRNSGKEVALCRKATPQQQSYVLKEVDDSYTTESFVAQTLTESILSSSAKNRVVTIAHNPLSAMLISGRKGECYWLDKGGKWSTAECYASELPSWVRAYNNDDLNRVFATDTWYGRYTSDRYLNSRATEITIYERDNTRRIRSPRKGAEGWVNNLLCMPSGNLAIFEFAKRAVTSLLPLHIEDGCKVLNICLDVPRTIAERYGVDSIEYEDMLYSLDASLAEFLTFLYAQLPSRSDMVVTLTSDSGISPTKVENGDSARFNTRQFEVIVNAFLSARYGQDAWVLGYTDGSLYLNHDVVYRHKKSLAEVQDECASFALKYRGVISAVSATALRSAQFSHGATSLLQNGYSARHSGDVLIALEPERIEFDTKRVAMSGSIYNYDRHIPLIVCGGGVASRCISERVSNEQIAPSLAKILGVERPQCSNAEVLKIETRAE